jgi:hypothetical protein
MKMLLDVLTDESGVTALAGTMVRKAAMDNLHRAPAKCRMSKPRPRPFSAFAAPSVRILATPITHGWRYRVRPANAGEVISYSLGHARATAARFSRKVLEIGPVQAFNRRTKQP